MRSRSSFNNLPSVHKVFYLSMLIAVPIVMAVISLILIVIVQVEEFMFWMMPIIFGVVSPIIVLKEMLNTQTLNVEASGMKMEKRIGKDMMLKIEEIKMVLSLRTGDRLVLLILSKDPSKIISLSDWFSMDDKEKLLADMKKLEEDGKLEIQEFNDKRAAMEYARALYK